MHHKNLKLREQFEAQAMGGMQRSDLFAGVTILVNGYTVRAPPWPAPRGPCLGARGQRRRRRGGRARVRRRLTRALGRGAGVLAGGRRAGPVGAPGVIA